MIELDVTTVLLISSVGFFALFFSGLIACAVAGLFQHLRDRVLRAAQLAIATRDARAAKQKHRPSRK